jgi:polar amino acid transport system substrate-binding protein
MKYLYWLVIFLLLSQTGPAATVPPLRLATFDYPPYITENDQGAQGLAANVVHEVFSRLGRQVQINFYPFTRGFNMLANRQVDGFFPLKKTPDRESIMVYPTRPLLVQDYVFFIRKDSPWKFDGRLESLAAARLGIVANTSYGPRFDQALHAGLFVHVDNAESHEMNLRKLLAGRVDVVPCSRAVGLYLLKSIDNGDRIALSGPSIETVPSYLVFSPGPDAARLASLFDQAMNRMAQDGTMARLLANEQWAQSHRLFPRRRP